MASSNDALNLLVGGPPSSADPGPRATRPRTADDPLLDAANDDIEMRARLNALLLSLCVDFINRPLEGLADCLSDTLQRIGEFIGVDHGFLYQFSEDGTEAVLTHNWAANDGNEVCQGMRRLPTADFAWEIQQLEKDHALCVPDAHQLPTDATGLRALCVKLGIKAAIGAPMIVDDELIGVLGFSSTRDTRDWSEHDLTVARVLVELAVSVLVRSRADRALRRSEARFRGVVRDQTELITRWTPDGIQHFVNDAVCRFLQRPQEEILGTSIYDRVHPDDQPELKRKLAALTPENPVTTSEHRTLRPDGLLAWHQWVARALVDESGTVVAYQTVGRDVTRLKHAQEELERRLGFEKLLLSLSTRFINLPLEQFDTEFNDALRQVTEFTGVSRTFVYLYDVEKVESRLIDQWSQPAAPPVHEQSKTISFVEYPWVLEKLRSDRLLHIPNLSVIPPKAKDFSDRLTRIGVKSCVNVPMLVDGEIFGHFGCSCLNHFKAWSDDDIALLRVLGEVLINALKRREAQQALATSERRLRLTIENVEEGVFDWDIQTGDAYISDHLKRAIGLEAGDSGWSFDRWTDRIHPDDRPQVIAGLNAHLEGRAPLYDVEYRFRTENGFRWTLSRGRVVERSADGQPLRMVGVQRDITSQIEQREEQRRQEARLTHLGRVAAMGETVAGIAHEINQPLHAASTFCAAASKAIQSGRAGSTENAIELCDKAAMQVQHAGEIIRKLREFTRPRPACVTAVNVNEVVSQTVEFVEQLGQSRGIATRFDLDPSAPSVQADRVQLQQVLVNLIQNACDSLKSANDPAPEMVISTRRREGRIEVAVRDNASTPPPEHPETLFDAFFTTKSEGMGIGLALCRTIVTAFDGEIDAQANPDDGMTFRFTIPLTRETT